jgi:hypothetical protein
MALIKFKTTNLPFATPFSKADKKKNNQFTDENIIERYAQSLIIPSDATMQIVFPSYVLDGLVKVIYSNMLFRLRRSILESLSNIAFVKDYFQFIQNSIDLNSFLDQDGNVTNAIHKRTIQTFDAAILKGHINELEFQNVYRNNYANLILIAARNSTSEVVGDLAFFPITKNFSPIYANQVLRLKGQDALDASTGGLTNDEVFRLILYNGERFQKMNVTYDTSNSDANPGQFLSLKSCIISAITLDNPINNI